MNESASVVSNPGGETSCYQAVSQKDYSNKLNAMCRFLRNMFVWTIKNVEVKKQTKAI